MLLEKFIISSVIFLDGWHSDERWSELIITCSYENISEFILVYALI